MPDGLLDSNSRSCSKELWIWWALASAIISWQLFLPPIIGLADQGDFIRILGPLGYAPKPKGPEHKYFYVTRKFVWDPSYREPRWEQISSEFIPAKIAVGLNRIVFSAQEFDINIFGFVHALLFLAALYRLLRAIQPFSNHRIAWAGLLLVTTDVGYVAYWNSLYTEPASCIWLMFLAAESFALCTSSQASAWRIARWNVFAVLWITAKTQNAALCIPLAGYGMVLVRRGIDFRNRSLAAAGIVGVIASGLVMYRSLLPAPRLVGVYNMIFMAILPEAKDPASDLRSLGLNPEYVRYSGTLAWSPGTGIADGQLVNSVQSRVTTFSIIRFYLARPGRMWAHIRSVLATALSLRPECCGNFPAGAGRASGAKSYGVALWSEFHERVLSRIAIFLFGAVAGFPLIGLLFLLLRQNGGESFRRSMEMAICLSTCCLLAFLSAAFGDAWEPIKHQYLFNLLIDACLIWITMAGVIAIRCLRARHLH